MLRAPSLISGNKEETVIPKEEIVPSAETSGAPTSAQKLRRTKSTIKMTISAAVRDSLEEIDAWMDQIPFSRPRRNISRDFSDGVLMAELLKRHYPRFVDLHNYMSKNGVASKIDNWSTLNRKVLSKIGMKLNKDTIVKLAYSEPGIIESVLLDLRLKILKDSNSDREALYSDYEESGKIEPVKSILVSEEVANKTVPRQAFVKLKHELQEKKSAITTLNERVAHLESLLKLKDQRILDLTAQLTGCTDMIVTPCMSPSSSSSARNRIN